MQSYQIIGFISMDDKVLIVVPILLILSLLAVLLLKIVEKESKKYIWVHIKTGNKYRIVANVHNKMRRPDTGEWLEAITYVNEEGEQFTRWKDDFLLSFQRLEEWEDEHKS